MNNQPTGSPDECDCAPSAAERAALWPTVTRRAALGAGALGAAALGLLIAPQLPAAYAAGYPSWDDVVRARANQAAKATEVANIQGLINQLAQNVKATQTAAQQASDAFFAAQEAFFKAGYLADQRAQQAAAQERSAADAATAAGRLAAQMYRNGGDDAAIQLLLSGSAAGADDLLNRLGQMDRLLDHNQAVYAKAITERNAAKSLSDQATVARTERDRLQRIAQEKMVQSQQAAQAAQAALDAQNAHLDDLQAQLAALKDTTSKTVAAYQQGVEAARQAEAERIARAKAQAEADAKAHGGGVVQLSGWCRPSAGFESAGYGPRPVICAGGYCSNPFHHGVDLADSCGTAIFAACSGTVVYAGYNGGLGNYIKIDHGDGTGSGYGHIRPGGIFVSYGQQVSSGQLIASEGSTGNSTGCHLHFETYINDFPVNPVPFMAARGVSV